MIEDIKGDLGGNFENVMVALMGEPIEFQARELHHAISGLGTDERTILEILAVHDNKEVIQISEKYQEYPELKLLINVIRKICEFYIFFQCMISHWRMILRVILLDRAEVLIALSMGNRDQANEVNRDIVQADVQDLYEAGEGSWGTEESVFNAILCKRSPFHLKSVFDGYEQMVGHPFEKAIENEFSGITRSVLLDLIMCLRNRYSYLATRLHDAMAGIGTDDKTLIRIIVSRSEIDLEVIKYAYYAKYSKSLAESVKEDTSGAYSKTLLAIIG
ncbi:hypothetical protein JTB14_008329 [Gonioctena quinquepunctata]|nr:hypothetical protein JTB14_008329 [Gonioctena quinquepunctata]